MDGHDETFLFSHHAHFHTTSLFLLLIPDAHTTDILYTTHPANPLSSMHMLYCLSCVCAHHLMAMLSFSNVYALSPFVCVCVCMARLSVALMARGSLAFYPYTVAIVTPL
jgi:hypothetical protein